MKIKRSVVKGKFGFRCFYYTNVGKVKANAIHLLLDISNIQESSRYWEIDNLALSDLSKLNVHLKIIYASGSDLMDKKV